MAGESGLIACTKHAISRKGSDTPQASKICRFSLSEFRQDCGHSSSPGEFGLKPSLAGATWMGRPRTEPAGADRARSGEAECGTVGGPGVTSRSSKNWPAFRQAPRLHFVQIYQSPCRLIQCRASRGMHARPHSVQQVPRRTWNSFQASAKPTLNSSNQSCPLRHGLTRFSSLEMDCQGPGIGLQFQETRRPFWQAHADAPCGSLIRHVQHRTLTGSSFGMHAHEQD